MTSIPTMFGIIGVLLASLCTLPLVWTGPNLQHVPSLNFSNPGHLTLGVLTDYLTWGEHMCSSTINTPSSVSSHLVTLDAFARINANSTLLGNITLGYIFYDECSRVEAAVAGGLVMVSGKNMVQNTMIPLEADSFDVIGVVGPYSSSSSAALAPLLNLFDVTMISPAASSDDLSDRAKYPNLFRMVPVDSFQTRVMVDMMVYFNWTYISVVYSEDNYGFNGLKFLRYHTRREGICIAESFAISENSNSADFETIARGLERIPKARVIVIFASSSGMHRTIQATQSLGLHNSVWILSDYGIFMGADQIVASQVVLVVAWFTAVTMEFQTDIEQRTIIEDWHNPYLAMYWKQFLSCDVSKAHVEDPCRSIPVREMSGFRFSPASVLTADAVHAFAMALDRLVRDRCPEHLTYPDGVKGCARPEFVREYLHNLEIPMRHDTRKFNKDGEIELDFQILQFQKETAEQVGLWTNESRTVTLKSSFQLSMKKKAIESVCAKPCQPGEFYIQGELPCCWDCRRCRNNEIVVSNTTTCEPCPPLTWPDNITFTTCQTIPPTLITWSDLYGLGLTIFSGIGLLCTITVTALATIHRSRRVVRGASLQMITIILLGLFITFANVPLLIHEPSKIVCVCNRLAFSLSSTLIFGPLFVKTCRVYLVFSASDRLVKVSCAARTSVQYILTASVISLQVCYTL